MPTHRNAGRHELGQNFLADRAVIARVVELASDTPGPLVDWGTGDGAITLQLAALGRPLEGVEMIGGASATSPVVSAHTCALPRATFCGTRRRQDRSSCPMCRFI